MARVARLEQRLGDVVVDQLGPHVAGQRGQARQRQQRVDRRHSRHNGAQVRIGGAKVGHEAAPRGRHRNAEALARALQLGERLRDGGRAIALARLGLAHQLPVARHARALRLGHLEQVLFVAHRLELQRRLAQHASRLGQMLLLQRALLALNRRRQLLHVGVLGARPRKERAHVALERRRLVEQRQRVARTRAHARRVAAAAEQID